MRMRYIQLFEEYRNDFQVNAERIIIDENLTRGQKIATSAGKDLLNKGQAAAAYLLALADIDSEDSNTGLKRKIFSKYGNTWDIIKQCFGKGWMHKNYNSWVKDDLSNFLNIKPGSLIYAKTKMEKMLEGDFEKEGSQNLYDVIIGYFNEINEMPKEELVELVTDYISHPEDPKYTIQ